MNTSHFDPTLFPANFPADLLPLAAHLELAVYTSEAFDLCAPPMGGWHYNHPRGDRKLRREPGAIPEVPLRLSRSGERP